MLLSDICK